MFASISRRPACALAAGTFGLFIAIAPGFAHVAPLLAGRPAHASAAFVHGRPLGLRAFNRFAFNRFGPHRFGFNRFGWNRNQLGLAGWGYWGGPWDYSGGQPPGPSAPIIVGGGPPVVINFSPATGDIGGGYTGGCVIHKLMYDHAGKYVGERQIPAC